MAEMNAVVAAVALIILAAVGSSSAIPTRYFGYRRSRPVNLSVHSPLTGTDIALSRAEAIYPLLNPGIFPGVYVNIDERNALASPDYAYPQDGKNQVVGLNPGLDNANSGGNPGPEIV